MNVHLIKAFTLTKRDILYERLIETDRLIENFEVETVSGLKFLRITTTFISNPQYETNIEEYEEQQLMRYLQTELKEWQLERLYGSARLSKRTNSISTERGLTYTFTFKNESYHIIGNKGYYETNIKESDYKTIQRYLKR